ncbi:hypothetical protein [Alicyclobacillus acidoterrestris]|uniref:Uncharacterized protein n=1 Tax=Alicyclobacillus acidoterrestris (strain ATCC 49025 / DSM 3922 / CIP 106132 / NCIMB 13137 / GD3B) TaxID=1356854 RepID=T0CWS8_ALIAG|nr:hypothetical protein [Alicyclobacillus acidoterrestris]EPZ43847.1 hypothetical protein N007_12070 [Alicyclobacillus acidoterrestris ATCC 49025]UNO49021.1 hypothetical protein K1I37_00140 [Alicyclobacillus acidoterrestris]
MSVTEGLHFSASGRPAVQCPNCSRLHNVYRRGDHMTKPTLRFVCRNCKTSWPATEEQKAAIQAYYKEYAEKKAAGTNPQRGKGNVQVSTSTPPVEKTGSKDTSSKSVEKRSWIDQLLS